MVALGESLADVDPFEADPYDVDPSTSRSAIHRQRAILLDVKEVCSSLIHIIAVNTLLDRRSPHWRSNVVPRATAGICALACVTK